MLRYYRVSSGIQNLDPSLLGQINIRWNPTLSVRRLGKPQIFFRDWAIFVPIPKFGLFFVIRSLVRVHCEASHAPPPSKISESGSNCSTSDANAGQPHWQKRSAFDLGMLWVISSSQSVEYVLRIRSTSFRISRSVSTRNLFAFPKNFS